MAYLPDLKTFEQFDFAFQPSIDERQIRQLRTLRFIHEASNVILLGPPGVGKTHLAVALAEAGIQAGQAAYFITAHRSWWLTWAAPTEKDGWTGVCACTWRPRCW